MTEVSLIGADLTGGNLIGVDLTKTVPKYVTYTNADLARANLKFVLMGQT